MNIAKELAKRFPLAVIRLIEKEAQFGLHCSSRNSGVLHAGFYYNQSSLKAKFCKQGNELMTKYFEKNKLPINYTGKLVVA